MNRGIIIVPPLTSGIDIYTESFKEQDNSYTHFKSMQKFCNFNNIEVNISDDFCYYLATFLTKKGYMIYELDDPTVLYVPLNIDCRQVYCYETIKKDLKKAQVGAYLLYQDQEKSEKFLPLMENNTKQTLKIIEDELENRFTDQKENISKGWEKTCIKNLELVKKQ